jgi:hypothetical protein
MAQIFCEKIALHRQLADLRIQPGELSLVCHRATRRAAMTRPNSDETPSSSVFFHAWIWLA